MNLSPQTAATTFAFSSIFILLLWQGHIRGCAHLYQPRGPGQGGTRLQGGHRHCGRGDSAQEGDSPDLSTAQKRAIATSITLTMIYRFSFKTLMITANNNNSNYPIIIISIIIMLIIIVLYISKLLFITSNPTIVFCIMIHSPHSCLSFNNTTTVFITIHSPHSW